MLNKINFLFVTLFGIGKIKKIPGSFASLTTTLFLFFLFHILNVQPNIVLIFIIIIFFVSLYAVNIFISALILDNPVAGWASMMTSLWFLGGVIVSIMGIVGLYVGKTLDESKSRPVYLIQEVIRKNR